MHKLLLKNIGRLLSVYDTHPATLRGKALGNVPEIEGAWMACEDGIIADYGSMEDFPGITDWHGLEVVDCTGKIVFPAFVDSHTHIVYAGNRSGEFADRLRGLSYEEIAQRGGGILNSVRKLRDTSEDELFRQALVRLKEMIRQGTGAVEIKSGYGLDMESELKMLRVIRRLRDLNWIPVKATFLGAHAVPPEFQGNGTGYVDYLLNTVLPQIATERLADFIDVFCERNYFSAEQTLTLLRAGAKFGLGGKVHAEQLSHAGGIRAGVEAGAVSVDHLEYCNEEDMVILAASGTIPTILPGAAFFLDLPRPPARQMIGQGLPVALATDYNPGSSPSGNMKLMMSIACVMYKLTTEEAFNMATVNGAAAMQLRGFGSISRGNTANFVLAEYDSLGALAYEFGSPLRGETYIRGQKFTQ